MFGCCCVNKKALKKEQQKAAAAKDPKSTGDGERKEAEVKKCDKNSLKSPPRPAADAASLKSPTIHDKSNSSDDDNNLSGLIMSDGLVGKSLLRILCESGGWGGLRLVQWFLGKVASSNVLWKLRIKWNFKKAFSEARLASEHLGNLEFLTWLKLFRKKAQHFSNFSICCLGEGFYNATRVIYWTRKSNFQVKSSKSSSKISPALKMFCSPFPVEKSLFRWKSRHLRQPQIRSLSGNTCSNWSLTLLSPPPTENIEITYTPICFLVSRFMTTRCQFWCL